MEYCIGNFWFTPLEIVSKFRLSELINFYSHLKSSENRKCSDDFRWNRSKINHLNSFNIWTEISRHLIHHVCSFCSQILSLKIITWPKSLFLLKKRLWHRCFPVNFVKFLRTPFFRTPLGDCFYKAWRLPYSEQSISKDFGKNIPANIYLFKVNSRSPRKRCEICSNLNY